MGIGIVEEKTVLITGGTGSFGQHYLDYLIENSAAKKIIIFSRDELKQSRMRHRINDERVRYFIGDVRDLPRLQRAFHGVDIVLHTAALKQIDTLEYNPFEAIKTNIIGTQNVIDAAIDQGVERVLFISSDKAVQPINIYGATKLCAEKLIIHGNIYSSGKTVLSAVRYGNVLGSRGSIIDTLLQAKDKTKVYITDERMTRFWITYEQAFELVNFALTTMVGGEIFVPKLPSMKILDVISTVLPNAEREVIGVRPGEKLHEILLTNDEARHAVDIGDFYVILPEDKYISPARFGHLFEKGTAVNPEFTYASHTNEVWLEREALLTYIQNLNDSLRSSIDIAGGQ